MRIIKPYNPNINFESEARILALRQEIDSLLRNKGWGSMAQEKSNF